MTVCVPESARAPFTLMVMVVVPFLFTTIVGVTGVPPVTVPLSGVCCVYWPPTVMEPST